MAHVRSSNRRIIRKRVNSLFLVLISLVANQPLFSQELIQFNFNNVEFVLNSEAEMIKMFRNNFLTTKVSIYGITYTNKAVIRAAIIELTTINL